MGGSVELGTSVALLAEWRDVFDRPVIRKKFKTLTDERVEEAFRRLDRIAFRVADVSEVATLARDPKDSKYLNLAIAADAKLIVSRDNDLLDLMTSEDQESRAFRTAYPDIAILDPVAFLTQIRSSTTDQN